MMRRGKIRAFSFFGLFGYSLTFIFKLRKCAYAARLIAYSKLLFRRAKFAHAAPSFRRLALFP
jgi:hypothetical protein